jgi:hypothetical protein
MPRNGRVKGSKDKTKRIRRWWKKPATEELPQLTKDALEFMKPTGGTLARDADKTETPAPVSTEGATA